MTAPGNPGNPGHTGNPGSTGSGPPAVPAAGAYLGAWVHPAEATAGPAFAIEQRSLPSLQAAVGRPLGILHVFSPWSRPAPVTDLASVSADESLPLLDWGCANDGAAVASGVDDRLITAYARTLRSFGRPVFLRWCWEMNIVRSHAQVGGPTGFVSAWRHIVTIFRRVGADNVSFVWCPAVGGVDAAPYYPGDRYVDWIGVDGYDHTGSGTFTTVFANFYRRWAGRAKPMMVGETGSQASSQAAFIDSIGTGMPAMPAFKAVVYFDAPGPRGSWQLTGDGLTAFAALARDPYLDPA